MLKTPTPLCVSGCLAHAAPPLCQFQALIGTAGASCGIAAAPPPPNPPTPRSFLRSFSDATPHTRLCSASPSPGPRCWVDPLQCLHIPLYVYGAILMSATSLAATAAPLCPYWTACYSNTAAPRLVGVTSTTACIAPHYPLHVCSPPNHKAISFCAFSTLSLPWMTLRPTSMQ